jgi:peroxiredoxin
MLAVAGAFAGVVMAVITVMNPLRGAPGSDPAALSPIPDRISAGRPAPDFTGQLLDGETVRLSDLRGQAVALNFWASWCAPCRVEMPVLQAAYERHAESGLVILAVNVGEDAQTVSTAVLELGLALPIVLDPEGDVSELYEVRPLPTTVWIDPDGVIRAEHFGALTEDTIEDYIADVMDVGG